MSVHDDFVPGILELRREVVELDVDGLAVQPMHLTCLAADQDGLLGFPGDAVAGGQAGDVDDLQRTFIDHGMQIAIDGGDAQPFAFLLGVLQNFFGFEGTSLRF